MPAALRWVLLSLLALAFILVPFALFEDSIARWSRDFLRRDSSNGLAAAAIAALLACDVLLPVPSSLVATAAGYLLGLIPGAVVVWAGMTAGGLLGYALGREPARRLTRRFVGEAELKRAARAHERWGDWAIIVCRSVPVLAEASVVFAGVAAMPLPRFLLLLGLSNLAIALVYSAVGALALRTNSFLLAVFGAIALPALAMLLFRRK